MKYKGTFCSRFNLDKTIVERGRRTGHIRGRQALGILHGDAADAFGAKTPLVDIIRRAGGCARHPGRGSV